MKITMAVWMCWMAAALVGCRDEPVPPTPPAPPPPQVEVTEGDTDRPAETPPEPAGGSKDELVAAAKEKLDELDARTAELRQELAVKSEEWSAQAKVQWEKAMEELELQKERAKVKWEELRTESEPVIADAREEFDAAMDKAAALFGRIKSKVQGGDASAEPQP